MNNSTKLKQGNPTFNSKLIKVSAQKPNILPQKTFKAISRLYHA